MSTETLREERVGVGPAPFSDEFGGRDSVSSKRVQVIHGVYAHSLPLVGMSISEARMELEERMNIHPESVAVIDGLEIEEEEEVLLRENQVLNFLSPAGEKG